MHSPKSGIISLRFSVSGGMGPLCSWRLNLSSTHWKKNQPKLYVFCFVPSAVRDVHSLVIRSVCHAHAGVYKSVISNKVGKATCYAHLYVTGNSFLLLNRYAEYLNKYLMPTYIWSKIHRRFNPQAVPCKTHFCHYFQTSSLTPLMALQWLSPSLVKPSRWAGRNQNGWTRPLVCTYCLSEQKVDNHVIDCACKWISLFVSINCLLNL